MPISTSYKDMIHNFSSEYKGGKVVCRKLTDGTSICASQKAWSVFFAYIRKKGLDETSSPKDEKSLMLDSADVAALEPKVINVKPKKDKQCLEVSVSDILLKAHLSEDIHCIDNFDIDIIHSYAHSIQDNFIHNIVVEEMEERGILHLAYADIDKTVTKLSVEEKTKVKNELLEESKKSLMKYGFVDGYGGYGGYAYGYSQPQPPATPSDYKVMKNQLGYYDVICKADGIVKTTCDTEEMANAYVQKLCIEHVAPQYL